MISSVNLKDLPIQDLIISGLIIFIMSTIIANIYDPLLGITYAFGNILTLTFLFQHFYYFVSLYFINFQLMIKYKIKFLVIQSR